MNFYDLLFQGVETNKRPLELTKEQVEDFNSKIDNKLFELVLNPYSKEIAWFVSLDTETAERICGYYTINPRSVHITSMVFLYGKYKNKLGK